MEAFKESISKSFLYLKKNLSGKIVVTIAIIAASWVFFAYHQDQVPKSKLAAHQDFVAEINSMPAQADGDISLITEPDDGMGKITAAISGASRSLDLVIYELEDSAIEQELVDAQKRGVEVKVILQNINEFGSQPNQAAYDFLKKNNVPVIWASDYFYLTHQKTLIADGASAIIMTFNFTPRYYATSRDFAVVDNNAKDVAAISSSFDTDWSGQEKVSDIGQDLVWSPGSADALITLIDSSSHSLDVYNEEMADPRIVTALENAAHRGVAVRIDMTYETNWKTAFNELTSAGATVRTYSSSAKFYIHAKGIFADQHIAFLGSENFSAPSLDANRELGILISRPDMVSLLEGTFEKDWNGARPFAIVPQEAPANETVVKLSKTGICHPPGDSSYEQTKNFTAYDTMAECLAAGGRAPSNAK